MRLFSDRPVMSEYRTLDEYLRATRKWLRGNPDAQPAHEHVALLHRITPKEVLRRAFGTKIDQHERRKK